MTVSTKRNKRLLSLLLSGVLLLSASTPLLAVPAKPRPVKALQKDGSTITVQIQGDEFFNWRTTEDGYPVVEKDGYYYYANYEANGSYKISDQRASIKGKRIAPSSAISKANMGTIAATASKMRRAEANVEATSTSGFPSEGDVRSLVILVDYYDIKFTVENPNQAFHNQLNQEGYAVEGATGSARDYFLANSHGKFRGQFDVVGPYTLSQPRKYYGGNAASGGDLRPAEMIAEAVKLAHNNGINFADYDFNNDGYVDNIFVYYAGRSEAEGGHADCVWPHKWNVPNTPEYDGKKVDVYACSSELRGSEVEDPIIAGIGTFCHEFSHVFGLADHYDTTGSTNGTSYGLGYYDIMTQGNYNNDGNTPPLHNALERMMIGWVDPIELDSDQDITLAPINEGTVYKMSTDIDGEFFLFENRNKAHSIWDKYIPGEGLLITHVDQSEPYLDDWFKTNSPNGDTSHECFRFIVAGNVGLDFYTGWDKVPYPYVDAAKPVNNNNEFSPNSKPKAISWSGMIMPYEVTDIARAGENITFKVAKATINSLTGMVKDSYGKVVGNATIKLHSNDDGKEYLGVSDDNGVMRLNDEFIPDGNYTITVTADSYADYTNTFDLKQGKELVVTMYSAAQASMIEIGYQNGEYSHSIGSFYQFRPTVFLPADKLKAHIGRKINEVRFYATAPFEGQIIVQQNMYGTGWSAGSVVISEDDLGWRTVDLSDKNIIIDENTDYYIKMMVMTNTEANPAIGMDTSTDESLYPYSSLLDQNGLTPTTIFSGNGIKGNLMMTLALSEQSLKTKPTGFKYDPAYDTEEGATVNLNARRQLVWATNVASENRACNWSSADESIATISGDGKVTGRSEGTTTVTGVSVLDPNIKMDIKVTVKKSEARGVGRAISYEYDSASGLSKIPQADVTLRYYQVDVSSFDAFYKSPALRASSTQLRQSTIENLPQLNPNKFKVTNLVDENEYTEVVTDSEGSYEIDGLVAGSKYLIRAIQDIYTDPWRATAQTTQSALVEYDSANPEATTNKLPDFELFANTVCGTERLKYYEGEPELKSVGDNTMPVMYAVKIPASMLVDKIGYHISHMEAFVYDLVDPYMEAVVLAKGEDGKLVYQGGTTHGESDEVVTNGQHIFAFINEEMAIVRPNTDYYVTVKMMGTIGAQTAADSSNNGTSNLVFDSAKGDFMPVSSIGVNENVNFQIAMFVKPREIDKISTIDVELENPNTPALVGVDYQLKATVNPSTATYKDVVWSSSNEKIATIDQDGKATFLKAGLVTLIATSKEYPDVKGEHKVNVQLLQGADGYVMNSDGNSVAGAKVTFYPATYAKAEGGELQYAKATRSSDEGIEVTSDENGGFYLDLEEGVYQVEASYPGLMDYQGVVTIEYGLNQPEIMLYQYVETLSDFMTYATTPGVDGWIGDESYIFVPYTVWDAEDLEAHVGKQITRFKALVIGSANIRFVVFPTDASTFTYQSPLIYVEDGRLEMVTYDIPADDYITIEEGKDYCVGYVVADYAEGSMPAVLTEKSETVPGKSNCIVYRNELTDLNTLYGRDIGSWAMGFYVQDAEQQKGLDITVGQKDAVINWSPKSYKTFEVRFGEEGGVQTTETVEDCKLELSGLKPGTKYNVKISGIETVGNTAELATTSFTTLGQNTKIPLILLKAYNGYKADEILNLKTLNTEDSDDVEWFVNDEKLPRNSIVLTAGKHKIQCRVQRGVQVYVTTRYINVE